MTALLANPYFWPTVLLIIALGFASGYIVAVCTLMAEFSKIKYVEYRTDDGVMITERHVYDDKLYKADLKIQQLENTLREMTPQPYQKWLPTAFEEAYDDNNESPRSYNGMLDVMRKGG